ncbi:MAG: alpha/beta hydrolase [Magnetococcales bacterium]|nr:alpha/beta hydrolase [Magnetococcales bacterium]
MLVHRSALLWRRLWVVVLSCTLSACLPLFYSRTEQVLAMARTHAVQPVVLTAHGFSLLALLKSPTSPGRLLVVYLEGDGFAWLDRRHLSPDPTPKNPLVVKLMLQDPYPAVAYLGRPCQYLDAAVEGCDSRYWSSHRYATEVVTAMSEAIDTLKAMVQAEQVGLVGYSGGGTVGALLAARRQDVTWLVTVAANLDVAAWTAHHQVSPMPQSLNPVDFAAALAAVPQMHFVGEADRLVPESILHSYGHHLPAPHSFTVQKVPQADHVCCWVADWPALLTQIPFRQ